MASEASKAPTALKRTASEAGETGPGTSTAAPKRQRVSRACDQCRSAREKCDGIHPRCFPCASQNRSCTWQEPKKKRGVQTGYIRTLELALGWIFDKIPGAEDALHGVLTHEGGQGRSIFVGKHTEIGNRLHRRWRRSNVHKEIGQMLGGGEAAHIKTDKDTPDDDYESDGDGPKPLAGPPKTSSPDANSPASEDTPKSKAIYSTAPGASSATTDGPSPINRSTIGNLPRSDDYGISAVTNTGAAVPSRKLKLPGNYWRLLEVYFSYTHCWLPILERHDILKTSYLYSPEEGIDLPGHDMGAAAHVELWSALALASFQEAASQRASPCQKDTSNDLRPSEIYQIARSMIPGEGGPFNSRHVNALLLLALVNLGCRRNEAAWILIGFAVRIALSLGLHHGQSANNIRRSHHTYLGCFLLDTCVSASINLPPHLRTDDIMIMPPPVEDDLEEWQPWNPCPGFESDAPPHRQSRNPPSHSLSSFTSLFGIHKVLCYNIFATDTERPLSEDRYLLQIQNSVSDRRPFGSYIWTGESPTIQIPSTYLLRLAFLSAGALTRSFTDSLPLAVLKCLNESVSRFGICGSSPLFPMYMQMVRRHYSIESLSPEDRSRWEYLEDAFGSVWDADDNSSRAVRPDTSSTSYALTYQPSNSSLINSASISTTPMHQLPTPTSFYADSGDPAPGSVNDLYVPTAPHPLSAFSYSGQFKMPPRANAAEPQPTSATPASVEPSEPQPPQMMLHARPSFGSNTQDYEAILDDLASMDYTDRAEADPQFMANLGFAPGSNLAEMFSHDFVGFP